LDLGDGEFLLAVAWVTEDAKRYHEMYPYVLGFDVIFGTNQEKRPHMRGTGKTSPSSTHFSLLSRNGSMIGSLMMPSRISCFELH
jgi:hypothetical protein